VRYEFVASSLYPNPSSLSHVIQILIKIPIIYPIHLDIIGLQNQQCQGACRIKHRSATPHRCCKISNICLIACLLDPIARKRLENKLHDPLPNWEVHSTFIQRQSLLEVDHWWYVKNNHLLGSVELTPCCSKTLQKDKKYIDRWIRTGSFPHCVKPDFSRLHLKIRALEGFTSLHISIDSPGPQLWDANCPWPWALPLLESRINSKNE